MKKSGKHHFLLLAVLVFLTAAGFFLSPPREVEARGGITIRHLDICYGHTLFEGYSDHYDGFSYLLSGMNHRFTAEMDEQYIEKYGDKPLRWEVTERKIGETEGTVISGGDPYEGDSFTITAKAGYEYIFNVNIENNILSGYYKAVAYEKYIQFPRDEAFTGYRWLMPGETWDLSDIPVLLYSSDEMDGKDVKLSEAASDLNESENAIFTVSGLTVTALAGGQEGITLAFPDGSCDPTVYFSLWVADQELSLGMKENGYYWYKPEQDETLYYQTRGNHNAALASILIYNRDNEEAEHQMISHGLYGDNNRWDTYSINLKGGETYFILIDGVDELSSAQFSDKRIPDPRDAILFDNAEVSVSIPSPLYYTGLPVEPEMTVIVDGEPLELWADYATEYENNTYPGWATVTITGVGRYDGVIQEQFYINKGLQDFTVDVESSTIAVGEKTSVTIQKIWFDFYNSPMTELSFESDHPEIATVTEVSGGFEVTGVSPGTANITIKAAEDETFAACEKTFTVTVVNGRCGENLTWTLDDEGILIISGSGEMSFQHLVGSSSPFAYNENIICVIVEDGVTNIADEAFLCCENLECVFLPDSITEIGESAFEECTSLTYISIPEGVTTIGDSAFLLCSSLNSITLPDSLATIGQEAFCGCTGLTGITIPVNLTTIGQDVFCDCTGLKTVIIPDGVKSIGESMFQGCTGLETITLPDSVKIIKDSAFEGCTSLKSFTIPSGVNSIKMDVFSGCSSLESITIPISVTSIGQRAFEGCTSLKDVYYEGSRGDWTQISIPTAGNESLENATLHCAGDPDLIEWSSEDISIDYDAQSFTYNGERQVLQITEVRYQGSVLTKGTDYILVEPLEGQAINAGIYEVEIHMMGSYREGMAGLVQYKISPASVAVPTGKTLTYNGKAQTGVAAGPDYTISGNVKTNAGTYTATLILNNKTNYMWSDGSTQDKAVKWTIAKAANPLKISAKSATVKYSKVKNAAQNLTVTKVITFTKKGQGTMSYTKASGNSKITINKKTGKVTVKKGLKKGTYKVKVKVKAAGNSNYKVSAVKTVTFKIIVK